MTDKPTYEDLLQRISELERNEHQRSEEALRGSDQRFRRFAENSLDMIYWMSLPDGKYEYVSPAATAIFGYSPEEWYRNPNLIRQIIHEDFISYFKQHWENLLKGLISPTYEYKFIHKDGDVRWANQRNVLVRDDEERPVAVEGIVTDITERKLSEDLLLRSKNKLEETLDATPFPVAVVDLHDENIHFWSRTALELFGHTAPTTEEWYQLAYPDPEYRQEVIERWKPILEKARESSLPVNTGEYRVTCKDGTERICELYATFIPDNLIVTFSDITDRKQVEESLYESNAILQAAMDQSSAGIAIADGPEGKLRYVNNAGLLIRGGDRETIVNGVGINEYVASWQLLDFDGRPLDTDEVPLARAILFGETNSREFVIRRALNDDRIVFANAAPIRDKEGKVKAGIVVFTETTERRKAEEELRRSENQLRTLINTIPDLVWLKDTNGVYLSCNQEFERFFGAEEKEIIGKTDYSYVDKDLADFFVEQDRKAIMAGAPTSNEELITYADSGKQVLLETIKTPMYDDEGKLIGILGVGRNITRLKQTEKELKENETRYLALFNYINSGVAIYRPIEEGKDFTFVNINLAGQKITRIKRSEVIGKRLLEEFPKMANTGLLAALQQVYHSGTALDMPEFRYKDHKREGWRKNFIYKLPTGEIVTIFEDITDRKLAEEEISRQQKLFETMFNTIPDGVVITNTDREIQLANMGMETTFGYKPDDLLGKSTEMLYADRDKYAKTGTAVFGQKAQAPKDRYITYYRNSKGIEFPGETFGAKLFDDENRWLGNLGIMRDVSERIRVEEEGKKVQKQLLQAQKMEAIGTLAGGIAHDFNNILGAILGYSEIAYEDCSKDSKMAGDLEQIIVAGNRARDLVSQILAFSRQTEGERILLQPAIIIKEALKLLRSTLPTTIEIKQDLDFKAGSIVADPTQIHQILMNICTNAFHAMEETGGTLTVSLKKTHLGRRDLIAAQNVLPGDFIQFSVKDTGRGIPLEIRDKIFDPFFTTKEIGKGTGMGLSIAHGIVISYGGFMRCDSEVGKGTVFHIFIPVADQNDHIKVAEESAGIIPTGSKNEHILVVDDEKLLAEMTQSMLERLGYQVTVRTNSLEALTTFRNDPDLFDLVITDQTMPGMTGVDLACRMLQIRPQIPIILCTGFSNLISEEKATSMGIKGFAMKPIVKREITTLIRKVLSDGS